MTGQPRQDLQIKQFFSTKQRPFLTQYVQHWVSVTERYVFSHLIFHTMFGSDIITSFFCSGSSVRERTKDVSISTVGRVGVGHRVGVSHRQCPFSDLSMLKKQLQATARSSLQFVIRMDESESLLWAIKQTRPSSRIYFALRTPFSDCLC